MPQFELQFIDLVMVALYILVIVGIGFYFSRQQKSTDDYFLAGRSLTWGLIGFSLYASNMSTSSLVGMAGEAYSTGIAVFNYEWMAVVVLIIFALFFLPFYLRSQIFTMPEFLERRFDERSRYYFSVVTVTGNILIDTAGALYAGALVIQLIYPEFPMWQSVVILAVLSGLYTIAGGLKAVVYTDAIQAVLLLMASVAVSWIAWEQVGSWQAVKDVTPPEMLSLIRPATDDVLPWPGLLTGVFLLGFYFWGTNQFMVQRTLGAKDLDHGRWGALFAGLLKVPVIFIMVLPGTFARVLYSPDTYQALAARPDMVFPTMLFDLLPIGVRGLVLAALVAAIMSSVDSTLNSASTLVTMDFIKKLRPDASNKTLVVTGRVTTFVFMMLAAAWAPLILNFPSLWQYLQNVLAYLSPPVVACFVMGLFWPRANRHSAFAGLIVGHAAAIGMAVMQYGFGLFTIQFLYIPAILVSISAVTIYLVSVMGEEPDPEKVAEYTWTPATFREEIAHVNGLPWYQNFFVQSAVLLGLIAVVIAMFW
ncbi:sodium:solute symporter [Longibacter sp.]|jgi:SSS family solute:Na+ symporter|uniref:sodium:solute symporter n=1 Tax=Longibacter sp. TaxID=2045415 RepID=UPI003EB96E75